MTSTDYEQAVQETKSTLAAAEASLWNRPLSARSELRAQIKEHRERHNNAVADLLGYRAACVAAAVYAARSNKEN